MTSRFALWMCLGLPLVAACVDDLTPATVIDRNRVLGAKVVIADAPTRAWPRPGEAFELEWLVVDEKEPRVLSWALVACAPNASQAGVGDCGGGLLGTALEPLASAGPPRLSVTVPADYAADEVLVLGVICAGGQVTVDASGRTGSCSAGREGETVVTSTVHVGTREVTNAHPDLSSATVLIGADPRNTGQSAWPQAATDPPFDSCLAADHPESFPTLNAGEEYTVLMRTDDGARETYLDGDRERREVLQISRFANAGEIDGRFSIIDDRAPEAEFDWKAPAVDKVPAGGLTVRFELVARDQRGGIARLTRWACVAPPG